MLNKKYKSAQAAIKDFVDNYGGIEEIEDTLDELLLSALWGQDKVNANNSANLFDTVTDLKIIFRHLISKQ